MSIELFLEKTNVYLLWDVLIDEPMIKQICNSQIKINELKMIFESNIKAFYLRENKNCNTLVDLNKKYILLLINYIIKLNDQNSDELNKQKTVPYQEKNMPSPHIQTSQTSQTSQTFKKITIHQDEIINQPPITYEEIHNERLSKFEKDLNKRQEEFSNAMALPLPPVPNFNDKLDQPMSEIELEIKRIQEQRNYDIEIINKNYNSGSNFTNSTWLASQETSIKTEKLNLNSLNSAIKNNNVINDVNEKHISWSKENKFYEPSESFEIKENTGELYNENNLFNKLKKININHNTDNNKDNTTINLQNQLDDVKNELSNLNNKINMILEKINTTNNMENTINL